MANKKIIKFSDKQEKLLKFFDSKYDEDEFNAFIIQLLTAYRDMKKKKIDLILLSELIKARPSNIDTVDIMSLIQNNEFIPLEKAQKTQNIPRKETKDTTKDITKKIEIKEKFEEKKPIMEELNPILAMGDLSDSDSD